MEKQPESTTDTILKGETLVSQVTPLLGTTPSKNTQIHYSNTPEDISDILGTRVYKRYVHTPLQTLDEIIINQPKHFLPLAEEAKRITEEIRIEKINEQWAGIPQEQLLNQSFNDQLNLIQVLEQLVPLQLAKEHLPVDIINILDIDEALPTPMDQHINDPVIQGSVTPTLKPAEKVIKCRTPAPSCTDVGTQEVDWPDVIPVEIPPQYNQQNEQSIPTEQTYLKLGPAEIHQLKDNLEGKQYHDLETYLSHHNMFEASEHICRDYRSRLFSLDDDKYYQEIDRVYQTYETPSAQDYRPANQAPGPAKLPKN